MRSFFSSQSVSCGVARPNNPATTPSSSSPAGQTNKTSHSLWWTCLSLRNALRCIRSLSSLLQRVPRPSCPLSSTCSPSCVPCPHHDSPSPLLLPSPPPPRSNGPTEGQSFKLHNGSGITSPCHAHTPTATATAPATATTTTRACTDLRGV